MHMLDNFVYLNVLTQIVVFIREWVEFEFMKLALFFTFFFPMILQNFDIDHPSIPSTHMKPIKVF